MGFAEIGRVLAESAETSAIIMIIISLAGLFAWGGSTLGAFHYIASEILAGCGRGMVGPLLDMGSLLFAGLIPAGISIYLITLPTLDPTTTKTDNSPYGKEW